MNRIPEHGDRWTVPLFRQLDGTLHGFLVNRLSRHDVLDADFGKDLWMFLSLPGMQEDLEGRHLLTLLRQNRDYVHRRATGDPDGNHLHRAETIGGSTDGEVTS